MRSRKALVACIAVVVLAGCSSTPKADTGSGETVRSEDASSITTTPDVIETTTTSEQSPTSSSIAAEPVSESDPRLGGPPPSECPGEWKVLDKMIPGGPGDADLTGGELWCRYGAMGDYTTVGEIPRGGIAPDFSFRRILESDHEVEISGVYSYASASEDEGADSQVWEPGYGDQDAAYIVVVRTPDAPELLTVYAQYYVASGGIGCSSTLVLIQNGGSLPDTIESTIVGGARFACSV